MFSEFMGEYPYFRRRPPKPRPLSTRKKAQLVAWARVQLQHRPRTAEEEQGQVAAEWILRHYNRDKHTQHARTR
jgi:hypothetical protein